MSIGQNIKRRRRELDMTLESVAKELHLSRQTLSRYETGVIGNIPSDTIEALARVLRTSPAYLMGWEENEKPTPAAESGLSPDYDRLNAENKAFIDSMIEKLLKSQSDD